MDQDITGVMSILGAVTVPNWYRLLALRADTHEHRTAWGKSAFEMAALSIPSVVWLQHLEIFI
jgi:hypothetical protein